jgi:hypothetical protein
MGSARRFSHRERGENPKQLLTRLEISFFCSRRHLLANDAMAASRASRTGSCLDQGQRPAPPPTRSTRLAAQREAKALRERYGVREPEKPKSS